MVIMQRITLRFDAFACWDASHHNIMAADIERENRKLHKNLLDYYNYLPTTVAFNNCWVNI